MKLEYTNKSMFYKTVKEVLKSHFHLSERLILKLKRHQQIYLNGQPATVTSSITEKDIVCVELGFKEKSENILAKQMPLSIVFEDEAMLILNKPANIPVHPSMSHFSDSLSNGVQYYFQQNHIDTKIRPVNRLDKGTSRPCHIR